jgi:hypothetical protein
MALAIEWVAAIQTAQVVEQPRVDCIAQAHADSAAGRAAGERTEDRAGNGAEREPRRAGHGADRAAQFGAAPGAHGRAGCTGQRPNEAQDATGEVALCEAG